MVDAPVYRYYTVDLLSNEILAEIPFRGVRWGRALKSAGAFSGQIPVNDATDSMDLYETTMPGKTALYVVRNGECVWGGIIWSRDYDIVSKNLTVNGLEFTSYLHHRKIWKTWSHQFEATATFGTNEAYVEFTYGTSIPVLAGSTVQLEFDNPSDFKNNGFYRVATSPAPTSRGFNLVGGASITDIRTIETFGTRIRVKTLTEHGYSPGDTVRIETDIAGSHNGTYTIESTGGLYSGEFVAVSSSTLVTRPETVVTGIVSKHIPEGTYTRVTVIIRSDTYDYVRALIDSMSRDFMGTDFPNVYIEPGISTGIKVKNKKILAGAATITTETPHELVPGQAVQLLNVGAPLDGEFKVLETPFPDQFIIESGGTLAQTSTPIKNFLSLNVSVRNGEATFTTTSNHGLNPGDTIYLEAPRLYSNFTGYYLVQAVPTPDQFKVNLPTSETLDINIGVPSLAVVADAAGGNIDTISIINNVATVTMPAVENLSEDMVGDDIWIIQNSVVVPLGEKSYDKGSNTATIRTPVPHGLATGDTVTINGVRDASNVVGWSSTGSPSNKVTLYFDYPHNFTAGSAVNIEGLTHSHTATEKRITTGGVARLGLSDVSTIPVGASITVSGIVDTYNVTSVKLSEGVAEVTVSGTHNIRANDAVAITDIQDTYQSTTVEAARGIAIVTFSRAHNILEEAPIVVSGLGPMFDGERVVLSRTANRIFFGIDDEDAVVYPTARTGTITVPDGYFNGDFVVDEVSGSVIKFRRGGNDMPSRSASGSVFVESILNGVHTVSARDSSTTISYVIPGANNMANTVIDTPSPEEDEEAVIPTVSGLSDITGSKTITSVSSYSVSFTASSTAASGRAVMAGTVTAPSIFNGTRTVTRVDPFTFTFSMSAAYSQIENNPNYGSSATLSSFLVGTHEIVAIDVQSRSVSFAVTRPDMPMQYSSSTFLGNATPTAVTSTFGPFPGNSDIGIKFGGTRLSGHNLPPLAYRGFELKTVGDALDEYSDAIDGFGYRIDCSYNAELDKFERTFIIVPNNFPDPPLPGEVSPIERFGADRLVFEYPQGNITAVALTESAENSATRFFALGESDLGPEAGPNIGIASAKDMLSGMSGNSSKRQRKWPLLDASEQVDDVDDEYVLYTYAKRYLAESLPPDGEFTITVNGSIAPLVTQYVPGDWCSIIIRDPFVSARLKSDLEPRDSVIVRKIDGFEVTVPDGSTFPETVAITLIKDTEVDSVG